MTEIPMSQAKNRLASIIHEAEAGDSIKLTRHGKPAAMLIGLDEY
jgi:prevent-host-death family protein